MLISWLPRLIQAVRGTYRHKRSRVTDLPPLEWLEERCLLTPVSWISDSDGFWDVDANWSTGQAPGSGDDVTIDRGIANPVITIRDNRTVNSIISRESLLVATGTFQVNAASQVDASKLTLDPGTALIPNGLLTVTSTGEIDWQGGGIFGHGLVNQGTIVISADENVRFGGTVNNNGTISHTGTGSLLFDASTRLNNNVGGVYDFAGDGDIGNSNIGGGFVPFFQNDGTLRKSAGAAISQISGLPVNTGAMAAFDVTSGRLNIAGGGTWIGGTFTGGSAGVLEIGSAIVVNGNLTGTGNGHLELTGSISSFGGGATLIFPAG